MRLKFKGMSEYIGKYKLHLSILIDIVIFAISFGFAYWITDGFVEPVSAYTWSFFPICSVIVMVFQFAFKCYRVEWKYAGLVEIVNILFAYLLSLLASLVLEIIFFSAVPVAMMILFFFMSFSLSMLFRMLGRFTTVLKKQFKIEQSPQEKVIIYGGGYTGAVLVKRFCDKPEEGYDPVAIIDDDPKKHGKVISGVTVIGGREVLPDIVQKHGVKTVIIAISRNATREQLIEICHNLNKLNLNIKLTSSMSNPQEVLNSQLISLNSLNIGELLHRAEHKIDMELVDSIIRDKVIMVTGGAGSIGSEICRQALIFGCKKVIVYDHSEYGMFELGQELGKTYPPERYALEIGSVRDINKIRVVMEAYKPETVFHAAAYKHVPMMELSADEAVKNNVAGTENVINQCNASGVKKFILISTDKAINPANVMGATKRLAELVLEYKALTSVTHLAAVRFGNVLGSSGSVIPIFMNQINKRENITVTHEEMRRYFMTIPEAVRLVFQAGAMAKGGEVFVLDMGDPVYIKDLAKDLIRISGLELGKDINIKYTGLRDGEKMFEELSYNNENSDKTVHEGIFVCKLEKMEDSDFDKKLTLLKELAAEGEKEKLEEEIFKIVPSVYRKRSV